MSTHTGFRFDGDDIPLWNKLSYNQRSRVVNGIFKLFVAMAVLAILFPIYWTLATALRTEVVQQPIPLIPTDLTFEHFRSILFAPSSDFLDWYFNTIVISLGVVFISTTAATLGGYGLTRLEIPFKKTFARGILFGYMFPPILLAIPMFIIWRQLGWINSYIGVIMAETAVTLPFGLWLMWKFFQTVPHSLEESAQMAGASRFQAFYEVALPMAKPGMIAVAVFAFAISWGQYTIPQVLLTDSSNWVLVLGIESYTVAHGILWGEIMAASFMALLPPLLFLVFLQKYLLRGFSVGEVG